MSIASLQETSSKPPSAFESALEKMVDLPEEEVIIRIKSLNLFPDRAIKMRKKEKEHPRDENIDYRSNTLAQSIVILSDGTIFRTGKVKFDEQSNFCMIRHNSSFPGGISENFLAKGAVKTVFKVMNLGNGVDIAVAVCSNSSSYFYRSLFFNQLKREYEITQSIDSPYIHKIQCISKRITYKGKMKVYLTSELCQGSLVHFSLRYNPEFLEHIEKGVAAAHKAGVWHNDLAPRNILISMSGTALVSDFGMAKQLSPDINDIPSSKLTPAQRGEVLRDLIQMDEYRKEAKKYAWGFKQSTF